MITSSGVEVSARETYQRGASESTTRLTAILMDLNGFSTLHTKTFVSREEEAQCNPEGAHRRDVIRPVWDDQREEILMARAATS